MTSAARLSYADTMRSPSAKRSLKASPALAGPAACQQRLVEGRDEVFRSGESRSVLRFGRRAGERDFEVGSRWCNRWGTTDKDSSKADESTGLAGSEDHIIARS